MSQLPHHHDHSQSEAADAAPSCGTGCALAFEPSSQVNPAEIKWTFSIEGLDCADEVSVLRREMIPLLGDESTIIFDVISGKMSILKNANPVSLDLIQRTVAKTGMSATLLTGESGHNSFSETRSRRQAKYSIASGIMMCFGVIFHFNYESVDLTGFLTFTPYAQTSWAAIAAYSLAIALGGRFVAPKAWYALKSMRPDINLLMVIAAVGAIIIGEWFEAAAVAFLFSLSLAVESWSVDRARNAISSLLDLAPAVARVLEDHNKESQVGVEHVAVGSRVVIMPGERIPLDGEIRVGSSLVDQAAITGESVAVEKHPGDEVYAGTVNGEGMIEIVTSKIASDTNLARIIHMIEEARSRRARSEQWVERFAAIYTPAIIIVALCVFLLPPVLMSASWIDWFYRALVLLVIGCPCALVISTPVSIVAALTAAARQGVLIKGGVYLENFAKIKAIAFDKTGTLTQGRPVVVDTLAVNGYQPMQIIEWAAALENRSGHPLALAIMKKAQQSKIQPRQAQNIKIAAGKGVSGNLDGCDIWVGSHRYMQEMGLEIQATNKLVADLEADGKSTVMVATRDKVCGVLALADEPRPASKPTLIALAKRGVKHLVMLSGDNRAASQAIAKKVGINEVHADLLPQDKLEHVRQLTEKYKDVALVGDGINDAPAMASATIGIAMGAIGTDTAIETADIALMKDDLSKLPMLFDHSQRTMSIIRQNIVFAIAVKLVFVGLTIGGQATLWEAIAADIGASLLVVSNALRLLKVKSHR